MNSNTVLYGVWELVILDFNLTVQVSGVNMTLDPDQCFVFRLQGNGTDGTVVDITFMVYGSSSVTIADLPKGTYTLSGSGWAWRYTNTDGAKNLGTLSTDTTVSYTVVRTIDKWLGDNTYVKAP